MISEIVSKINGKPVMVDACVSKDMLENLAHHGIKVRHVGDIDSHLKDEEIAKLMTPDEILLTRDYGFYKALGPERAILLMPKGDNIRTYPKMTKQEKRAIRKNRLSAEVRAAVRETIENETKSGHIHVKILWGLLWLWGYIPSGKL